MERGADMNHLPQKALSIRQPWAWAILNAGKRIENRPRRFHYRGPICLHASKADYRKEIATYRWTCQDVCAAQWHSPLSGPRRNDPGPKLTDLTPAHYDQLDLGGIVGTADIIDCVEESDSPWFFGPYGLVLDNVQSLQFIPVKGALGLFDWRKRLNS